MNALESAIVAEHSDLSDALGKQRVEAASRALRMRLQNVEIEIDNGVAQYRFRSAGRGVRHGGIARSGRLSRQVGTGGLMNKIVLTAAALVLAAGSAVADTSDEVLAVANKALAAVTEGGPDAFLAVILEDANIVALVPDKENPQGGLKLRMRDLQAQLALEEPDGNHYVERWLGEPEVNLMGPIASVTGRYEFFVNDARTHCGFTQMELVLTEGEWMISHWSFTVEPEGCPAH